MLDKVLNLLLYCVCSTEFIVKSAVSKTLLYTSNLFFKTPFDGNYFYVKNIQGKQLAISVVFRHGNETLQNCPGNLWQLY